MWRTNNGPVGCDLGFLPQDQRAVYYPLKHTLASMSIDVGLICRVLRSSDNSDVLLFIDKCLKACNETTTLKSLADTHMVLFSSDVNL